MATKAGGSHALAAFVSMIAGSMLTNYVKEYAPPLAELGVRIGDLVASLTGASLPQEQTGALVVILGLSFLWGFAYHVTRH